MVGNPDFLMDSNEESSFSSGIQELQSPEGELYLRFFIPSGDELALPANSIREVMQQSPERITPIPNASPLLLGTINLRGQVIWVADLGQFLGQNETLNTQKQEICVIAIEDQEIVLGLAIDSLGDMDWLVPEDIKMPPTKISDIMSPFVPGEWELKKDTNNIEEKVLKLLDHVAVLRSARWAT